MTIGSKTLAPVVLAVFVIGIGATMAFNLWNTESSKEPARYVSGEFAGEYNPGDIRGSYSFDDIEEAFDVPVEVLAQAFGAADRDNPGAFQAKELEELYQATADGGEVGTDAVRLFVALYTRLPYVPEESTVLPAPALSFLKDKLAPADFELLRSRAVSLGDLRIEGEAEETDVHTEESEDTTIKGKTTFDELLQWGVSQEEIEAVLGMEMGARGTAVRDFMAEQGLEFSTFKTALQELVDSKQ